jgi:hypothetical protein
MKYPAKTAVSGVWNQIIYGRCGVICEVWNLMGIWDFNFNFSINDLFLIIIINFK